LRSLVTKAFTVRRVEALRHIQAIADTLLTRSTARTVDMLAALAHPLHRS
jgi:cytochrome P450